MIKITRFFYVHSLVLPLLAVAFFTNTLMTFFISYSIVLLHELCHLFAALLLKVKVYAIVVMPFGMTVRMDRMLRKSPKKEALIALAGPLANAVLFLLGRWFLSGTPHTLNAYLFLFVNGAMLLVNLLPVPPLDGGRILQSILGARMGFATAAKAMRVVSYVFSALLLTAGVFMLVLFRGNPSLLMIGGFLLYHIADEKKNSDLLWMRQLVYEKELLKERNIIPTKLITVKAQTPAKEILKKLNFSTFYLVAVLDETLCVTKTVTECEVINAIVQKGYGVPVKDVAS